MRTIIPLLALTVVLGAPGASGQQPASNEVRLCEHVNYVGDCQSYFLEPGMRQLLVPTLPGQNDEVSSIFLGHDVIASVFTHAHFRGAWARFTESKDVLSKEDRLGAAPMPLDWNDVMSSLIVSPALLDSSGGKHGGAAGVLLFNTMEVWGKQTKLFPLPQSSSEAEARFATLGAEMNDAANNVRLFGNIEVELYEHASFNAGGGGNRIVLPGLSNKKTFYLGDYGLAGKVSSLIVRVLKPPTPKSPARGGESAGPPHRAPPAGPVKAVIPGPIAVPGGGGVLTLEPGTNRPGHDYRSFDISDANPELCREACRVDIQCRAFTYVKPGIQGREARCWLKGEASPAQQDPCCASGIRR